MAQPNDSVRRGWTQSRRHGALRDPLYSGVVSPAVGERPFFARPARRRWFRRAGRGNWRTSWIPQCRVGLLASWCRRGAEVAAAVKAFRDRSPYAVGIASVTVILVMVMIAFAVGTLHLLEHTYSVKG